VSTGYGNPGVHFQKAIEQKYNFNNLPQTHKKQVYNSGNPGQFGQSLVPYQGKNYRRFDNFKESVREDMFSQNFVTIDRPSSFPKNQKK